MTDSSVVVGGEYVEDEDFVPNPADIKKQFNTVGLGASGRLEETSSVFEIDKVKTAEHVLAALDPDDRSVNSSAVVLPSVTTDNKDAREEIIAAAQKRVDQGVVVGAPGPAEAAAGKSFDTKNTDLRAEGTSDETVALAAKHSGLTAADVAPEAKGDPEQNEGETKAEQNAQTTHPEVVSTSGDSTVGPDVPVTGGPGVTPQTGADKAEPKPSPRGRRNPAS